MNTIIFVPKKIKIGFQERGDTYTKKLAYVIYYDQKGTLRKEASWQSWRDKKIDPLDFENVPMSGFVLNKKVGGYSTGWNHRQTYVRVYDPRNFEFEISVPNLLYLLENTNSIKGKGLEGEFVYGWEGTELVLVPTTSPDFVEIEKFNEVVFNKEFVKSSDLKLGAKYKTKANKDLIYLGLFNYYGWNGENKGKYYFFLDDERNWKQYIPMKSVNEKFISVAEETCAENYAELIEGLEKRSEYSPYDQSKDEFVEYTLEELKNKLSNAWYSFKVFTEKGRIEVSKKGDLLVVNTGDYWRKNEKTFTAEEFLATYRPTYKIMYLKNGNLYSKEY